MHIQCIQCETWVDFEAETSIGRISCPECGLEIENVEVSKPNDQTLNHFGQTPEQKLPLEMTFVPDRTTGMSQRSDEIVFSDYEILQEIAHGGMGVVYKAKQKSLNRVVALKMILAGQLASKNDIKRFQSEAKAAAGLDHPNIVPVYEVGEFENQHFFSMGFVEGNSLAHKLIDGPLSSEEATKLTKTIADAVEYAHQKGIIHRDLKPANILLDENGQPKVTDFGLAKLLETDSNITTTGQILGTPSYMAPEQAAGKSDEVGVLSDVYALGGILYCLLTGRPPFQAANMLDTLKQVVEKEPISPRVINYTVDKDLETICLKCLEKEPSKRYQSAHELGEELERVLQKVPILARPLGRVSRFTRWTKRNPFIAGLFGTVAFVLLLGTGVSTYFAVEANLALADLEIEKKQSDLNAERATKQATASSKAVRKFVETVQNAKVLKEGRFKPLRKDLLSDALVFYQGFLDDPESHKPEEVARAILEIARISATSGDVENSLEAFRKSLKIFTRLVEKYPTVIVYRVNLATNNCDIGTVLVSTGKLDEAYVSYKKAIELQEKLVEEYPTVTEYQNDLAASFTNIGLLCLSTKKFDEALTFSKMAIHLYSELIAENPNVAKYQQFLAANHQMAGNLLRRSGNLDDALDMYNESLAVGERLVKETPMVAEYQNLLADAHHVIGDFYNDLKKPKKALVTYQLVLKLRKKLANEHPTVTEYQKRLAYTQGRIGNMYAIIGNPGEATVSFKKAIKLLQILIEENPTEVEFQTNLANNYAILGNVQKITGKIEMAFESYKNAIAIQKKLVEKNPSVTKYKSRLAASYNNLGLVYMSIRKPNDALESFKYSLELNEKLTKDKPTSIERVTDLGGCYVNSGAAALDLKDYSNATVFYEQGIKTLARIVLNNPSHAKAKLFLRNAYMGRAILNQKLGQFQQAVTDWDNVIRYDSGKLKSYFQKFRESAANGKAYSPSPSKSKTAPAPHASSPSLKKLKKATKQIH